MGHFLTATLIAMLIRQNSGLACAIAPPRTINIYAVLLVPHLLMLWDSMRALKSYPQRNSDR